MFECTSFLPPITNPLRTSAMYMISDIDTEYWWLLVSIIDASLLCTVAASNVPRHESSSRLVFLLVVAAFSNLGSAYVRFRKGEWLAFVNAAILFVGGSTAFIGACRVHHAIKELDLIKGMEEGIVEEEKIPIPIDVKKSITYFG